MKFDHIVVNKNDFHASKEAIALDLVGHCIILVSGKFKHSEYGFKHFIGYLHVDDVIRPLCIVLAPMSGYIKSMPFSIEDKSVYLKYAGIWNKIKKLLSVKFHSQPIHEGKYINTKIKKFGETINTLFSKR